MRWIMKINKKIIIGGLRLLSIFVRIDKKLITIMYNGYSGSNLTPIIKYLKTYKGNEYKINIVRIDKEFNNSNNILLKYVSKINMLKYGMKSKVILSTHGFYKISKKNCYINLWHGFPLKSMALLNKSQSDVIGSINDDIIATLSNLNTTVLNSCLGLTANQYCITGYPRNDYLYIEDGLQNLRKITGRDIKKKIILYMPTYKDNPDTEYNLFGFSKFDYNVFSNYLKENELFFMVKLHPNDEVKLRQKYDGFFDDNIFILDSSMLDKFELDLYQIINSVDLLITDYSSIYFDYLLLDRPIIFTPTDFDDYIKNRGILLEPYDFWTPGPKCLEQYNLQIEIIRLLDNKNYYSSERKTIKKLIHYYFDGKSTDRVIQLIIDKMDE